jgi:3-methyladenine DNA glycosylase AlkD
VSLLSRRPRRSSPLQAARDAKRELARLARPTEAFDASRYFRGTADLGFYNIGSAQVRTMARTIARVHRDDWSLEDAVAFAEALIADRYLEVKGLGIETLACFRRTFTPKLLPVWKRWLAENRADNWATTDSLCGLLIGPLLVAHPELVPKVAAWAGDRNMWVRRASAVGLIPLVRRGEALDEAYAVAARLHGDREDLIQKAVGWMLREAGKADPRRLERYLRTAGSKIPRTTVRYAIERFEPEKRRQLLIATRGA